MASLLSPLYIASFPGDLAVSPKAAASLGSRRGSVWGQQGPPTPGLWPWRSVFDYRVSRPAKCVSLLGAGRGDAGENTMTEMLTSQDGRPRPGPLGFPPLL